MKKKKKYRADKIEDAGGFTLNDSMYVIIEDDGVEEYTVALVHKRYKDMVVRKLNRK